MTMAFSVTFTLALCAFLSTQKVQSTSKYQKLLVVSYDGFRHDYFDRNVTPFMKNVKGNGTYTDYMINVFPTRTYPNHYTMATGFYTETHGVMDTTVYVANRTIANSAELFQYNKNILPIWIINEKSGNGRHSGVAMWPGSEFKYNGTVPEFLQSFNLSVPWKTRIDLLVSWFSHPKTPINFGMLYIEEPDFHGHAFGINAPIMDDTLKKIDEMTKYLHERLQESNLNDVNVVHLSDHGMISVTIDKIVNISHYINDIGYNAVSETTIIMITPDSGNEDIIYQRLKNASIETGKFDVYKKDEVPERYHFRKNPRVGDIVVSAKSGYAFEALYDGIKCYEKKFNITVNNQSEFGIHGYDNLDMNMHPMFFARGPAFASKCKVEPFNTVDLFPLFCHILDLKCPAVNGSLTSFSKCLMSTDDVPTSGNFTLITAILLSVVVVLITILMVYRIRKRRQFSSNYTRYA